MINAISDAVSFNKLDFSIDYRRIFYLFLFYNQWYSRCTYLKMYNHLTITLLIKLKSYKLQVKKEKEK